MQDYSFFNSYSYDGKNFLFSALDFLSTPVRRVFGGREVNLISKTSRETMSVASRVMTAIASILIFPVGVVSTVSLLLKLAVSLCEKRILREGFANDPTEGLAKPLPSPAPAPTLTPEIVKQKIEENTSWDRIQPMLRLLKSDEAIQLIDLALKKRLSTELERGWFEIEADPLVLFVRESFNARAQDIEACCEALFSSSLQIDPKGDPILSAIQLDLAHELLAHIKGEKSLAADQDQLRNTVCNHDSSYIRFFGAEGREEFQKIQSEVANIRKLSQIKHKTLALTIETETDNLLNQLQTLQTDLQRCSADEDESLNSLQEALRLMVRHGDTLFKAPSLKDAQTINKEITDELGGQCNTTRLSVSSHSASAKNLLPQLQRKKKALLHEISEAIQSFLRENMNRIIQEQAGDELNFGLEDVI